MRRVAGRIARSPNVVDLVEGPPGSLTRLVKEEAAHLKELLFSMPEKPGHPPAEFLEGFNRCSLETDGVSFIEGRSANESRSSTSSSSRFPIVLLDDD